MSGKEIEVLQVWHKHMLTLHKELEVLTRQLKCSPDSTLLTAIFAMSSEYTKQVSKIVGDDSEWLEWWLFEVDMGNSPGLVRFVDGSELLVDSIDKLLIVIKNG
jgi:hypothetical protein